MLSRASVWRFLFSSWSERQLNRRGSRRRAYSNYYSKRRFVSRSGSGALDWYDRRKHDTHTYTHINTQMALQTPVCPAKSVIRVRPVRRLLFRHEMRVTHARHTRARAWQRVPHACAPDFWVVDRNYHKSWNMTSWWRARVRQMKQPTNRPTDRHTRVR